MKQKILSNGIKVVKPLLQLTQTQPRTDKTIAIAIYSGLSGSFSSTQPMKILNSSGTYTKPACICTFTICRKFVGVENKKMIFEDTEFYTINNPEKYLEIMYGKNYMNIPAIIDGAKFIKGNARYIMKAKEHNAKI